MDEGEASDRSKGSDPAGPGDYGNRSKRGGSGDLPQELRETKRRASERLGFWTEEFDDVLRVAPGYFERYVEFYANTYERGPLDPKTKELVLLAANASVTHLNPVGIRIHARKALDAGATVDEVSETLQVASGLGVHTIIEGMPALEAVFGSPEPDADDAEAKERVERKFRTERGYWSDIWEGVLTFDHEFLDRYTDLSAHPWQEGTLDPKVREFVYITIDISTTHLYTSGTEVHMRNAKEYGATRDEVLQVLELTSTLGFDTMTVASPIVRREATDGPR